MAVNFASLLSKPVESAERPKSKPAGTYRGIVENYKFDTSREKKTPYVRFGVTSVMAGDDVDRDRLAHIDLTKYKPYVDFYITDDALFRLREFIESCGIDTKGRDFNETIPEVKSKGVIFTVIEEPTQDGQGMRNRITDLKGE